MTSMIDFVIATGIFFVSVAVVISFVLGYYSNFLGTLQESELRSSAIATNNLLFGGKGVPENWETTNTTPSSIGLMNDLFRTPVVLTTTNASNFNNATLNFTVTFDPSCANRTREGTIRVYNETNHEHAYGLYNKTYCAGNEFLRSSDVAVNVTIPALTSKIFFVYSSPETNVNGTNQLSVPFPANQTNYSAVVYPPENLKMVSPAKMRALRNLSYAQVAEILGGGVAFELEVDEQ
jgi:hypothetical protein